MLDKLARLLPTKRTRDRRGEDAAARHLKRLGWRILGRNLRTRFGEVDLVAQDRDGGLVFVEVKTGTAGQSPPEQRVNRDKRRRLESLAVQLVRKHGLTDRRWRFDVVVVALAPDGRKGKPQVRHLSNPFESRW